MSPPFQGTECAQTKKLCWQVIIEGHFTGQMVTQAHFMEVAMPLGATMPGVPVVELLRAMYDACKEMEDRCVLLGASHWGILISVDACKDE
eukprot:g23708.t1